MNANEEKIKQQLERQGFKVFRNGWPDFLVLNGNRSGFAIELKTGRDSVKPEQKAIHAALAQLGIVTYVIRDNIQPVKFKGKMLLRGEDLRKGMKQIQVLETQLKRTEHEAAVIIKHMRQKIQSLKEELETTTVLLEKAVDVQEKEEDPNRRTDTMQEYWDRYGESLSLMDHSGYCPDPPSNSETLTVENVLGTDVIEDAEPEVVDADLCSVEDK